LRLRNPGVRPRSSEWLFIIYFGYVALISPAFPLTPQMSWRPFLVEALVSVLLLALAYGESREHAALFSTLRDWAAVALLLVAYREIEALGALLPGYLELCYLLVYAVAPFVVAILYLEDRRERVNEVLFLYLLGTLLAYALFPYFPSDPPRVAFGGSDTPNVSSALRELNLWLVGNYGIHSSVFPSAHVSSAFSAAWALFAYLPERKRIGWGMSVYAMSVALATIYGRYHYAADVAAGIAVSLVPAAMILLARRLRLRGLLALP